MPWVLSWRMFVAPVLTGVVLRFPEVPVSVDTVKAVTARRALDAGAQGLIIPMVNTSEEAEQAERAEPVMAKQEGKGDYQLLRLHLISDCRLIMPEKI